MERLNLPCGYYMDDHGLHLPKDDSVLSNFILIPETVYYRGEDVSPFACRLACMKYDGSKVTVAPRKKLAELTNSFWRTPPPGCWYAPDQSSPHRHLRLIFNELIGQFSVYHVTEPDRLGWLELTSGEHVYVTGGEVIGLPEEQQDAFWIADELSEFRLEQLPGYSIEEALDYFRRLFTLVPGVTDVLLANLLASILFPIFQDAGITTWFSVMLQGSSESKKTTLAKLTCCMYQRLSSHQNSCLLSLCSTSGALRKRSAQMRHCTVVYDDLFPDASSALTRKSLVLLREQANQTPREVVSGCRTVGDRRESGLVFTVENFPACMRSTSTRFLRVMLDAPVPNQLLAPIQAAPDLLGNFLHEFILRISHSYDQIQRDISSRFRSYIQSRADENACQVGSERVQQIGFILHTSVAVALNLFQDLLPYSSMGALESFRKNMGPLLQVSSRGGGGQFTTVIPYLHRMYPRYFFTMGRCWCISPTDLCTLLKTHFQDPTISEKAILTQLNACDALSKDRSNASTKKVTGHGRCLFIIPENLRSS